MTDKDCSQGPKETSTPIDIQGLCWKCGMNPCEWIQYGQEVLDMNMMIYEQKHNDEMTAMCIDEEGKTISNAVVRKSMYRSFTYLKFGHLGKGNRVKVPNCVVEKIRSMYPEDDDVYMGHYDK